MNALVLAFALATRAAAPAPVAHDVWVTIDRDVLVAFERGGNVWDSTALGGGVDLARPAGGGDGDPGVADRRAVDVHPRALPAVRRVHGPRQPRGSAGHRGADAVQRRCSSRCRRRCRTRSTTGRWRRRWWARSRKRTSGPTSPTSPRSSRATTTAPSGNLSALSIRDKWTAIAAGRSDVSVQLFTAHDLHDDAALGDPHHHRHDVPQRGGRPRRAPGLDRRQQLHDQPRARRRRRRLRRRLHHRDPARDDGPELPPPAHGQVHGLRGGGDRPEGLQRDRHPVPQPERRTSSACSTST